MGAILGPLPRSGKHEATAFSRTAARCHNVSKTEGRSDKRIIGMWRERNVEGLCGQIPGGDELIGVRNGEVKNSGSHVAKTDEIALPVKYRYHRSM
jgi:hypothetical protein